MLPADFALDLEPAVDFDFAVVLDLALVLDFVFSRSSTTSFATSRPLPNAFSALFKPFSITCNASLPFSTIVSCKVDSFLDVVLLLVDEPDADLLAAVGFLFGEEADFTVDFAFDADAEDLVALAFLVPPAAPVLVVPALLFCLAAVVDFLLVADVAPALDSDFIPVLVEDFLAVEEEPLLAVDFASFVFVAIAYICYDIKT